MGKSLTKEVNSKFVTNELTFDFYESALLKLLPFKNPEELWHFDVLVPQGFPTIYNNLN